MLDFKGQTALITGSGTGIGLAIATAFAERGGSVIILGRRSGPLEEASAKLGKIIENAGSGASVRMFPGVDVADEGAITRMFEEIASSNTKLDVLVNNAGVSGPVTCFASCNLKDFESTIDIHLTGAFWTSREALDVMEQGSRIITISTFFTEERPLEQRPYRFRDPYTASQGAKNRLAEAISWELHGRGIISIATNPGPVHSDRIYKTVYPKAALEFLRVGGFEGLEPAAVADAGELILGLLGEDDKTVRAGISDAAKKLATNTDAASLEGTLDKMLKKTSAIAEKIQLNTSKMIADGQFLSQAQVAQTVLMLSGSMAPILNGKVIPGDRVFYPVRCHIGGAAPASPRPDLSGKSVVFALDSENERDAARLRHLATHAQECGARPVCLVSSHAPGTAAKIGDIHSHMCDLGDPRDLDRWLGTISEKAGKIAAVIHMTGGVPDTPFTNMGRAEWDSLVARLIKRPAAVLHRSLESFVPGGGEDPRLFAGARGTTVIIGPDLPAGKLGGAQRARIEVFRGALRPFTATLNQELADVLKSQIRAFLVLGGSVGGAEPDDSQMARSLDYFLSPDAASSAEVIFCTDEART